MTHDPDRLRRLAAEADAPRPSVVYLAGVALTEARRLGCTCAPDVHVGARDGMLAVDLHHDVWCPVARRITAPTN